MQPNPIKTQTCRACGRPLALSEFYANPSYTSGRDTTCKVCKIQYARRRLDAKGPAIREYHRGHYAKNREAKCQYQKDYLRIHGDAVRSRQRRFHADHRDEARKRSQEYARTHKDLVRANKRKYYEADRERGIRRAAEYKAKDPERWKQYEAEWRRKNPEYLRIKGNERRARIKGAGGRHTKEQLRELFAKQGGRCVGCGTDISEKVHSDHIMPIKRGGSNDISNIQLLCPSCNLRKNAKHPDDWRRSLGK